MFTLSKMVRNSFLVYSTIAKTGALGVLTLELDKSTYERAGLVGKAIRSGDRKHIKSRYSRCLPNRQSRSIY